MLFLFDIQGFLDAVCIHYISWDTQVQG